MAATITLRLDPATLADADLDLRYDLPDALVARSGGLLADDGYDHVDGGILEVFLRLDSAEPADLAAAVRLIRDFLATETLLGNDLRATELLVEPDPAT